MPVAPIFETLMSVAEMAAADRPAAAILGLVRGLVDFRERVGVANGDRAPLVDWWAAFIGAVDRVRLAIPARVDSIAKRAAWLVGQVAPALAQVHVAYGSGWLRDLIAQGEDRLTPRQWLAVGVVP